LVLDSPDTWRWIWTAATVIFFVGEMATAGSFFALPFGLGAALAAVLAFAGVDVTWQWAGFVVASGLASAVLWPLGRRMDRRGVQTEGTPGSRRWIGQQAEVIQNIPGGVSGTGVIRLQREQWRAESADGSPIEEGAVVLVVRIDGTRAVVERVAQ
jgi:membrane protein implicated in regulation of membrane protease activity